MILAKFAALIFLLFIVAIPEGLSAETSDSMNEDNQDEDGTEDLDLDMQPQQLDDDEDDYLTNMAQDKIFQDPRCRRRSRCSRSMLGWSHRYYSRRRYTRRRGF